jgi:hypothetical protein
VTPRRLLLASTFGLAIPAVAAPTDKKAGAGLETAKIEELTGQKGTLDAQEDVQDMVMGLEHREVTMDQTP